MDVDAKITAIHSLAGFIAAIISFIVSGGSIPVLGKNQALGTFIGLIILLLTGNIAERIFEKEEVGGFKGWLSNGVLPFIFVWFMVWAILLTTTTI
ncbi:MAG: hypothetical protein RBT32_07660 [Methanothermobacter sp.]|jgi:hypothetical protein|nr:DUF5379 family protein [Methanobacteriaceae archaeon]MDD3454837.1 hypothetical protein [Methanobacteriales archaeon]MDI3483483.1 hypothetical protein [Methanobacteriaceae archaeon]MDX9693988.1 hypothetical protein [Methanothermobacter sp.]HOQ20771.1 hypothetical protein [Methanothermobacter sp.]